MRQINPGTSGKAALAAALAVVITATSVPEQAWARGFGLGGFGLPIPIPLPHIVPGGRGKYYGPSRPSSSSARRQKGGDGEESGGTKETTTRDTGQDRRTDDKALAALARSGKLDVVLKSVGVAATLTAVGRDDRIRVGVSQADDYRRDLQKAVEDFVDYFIRAQGKTNHVGDITQLAIERALDKAYEGARLGDFERFAGENWTTERFKVAILQRARVDVPRLKTGTNQGVVKLADVEDLIEKSARIVYRRTFETSEFLAMNRSVANFIKYMSEHGGIPEGRQDRAGAESFLTDAAGLALTGPEIERQIVSDEVGYALRYRATRVMIDCFADRIRGEQDLGDVAEKVRDYARGACSPWVVALFSSTNLKTPMPQRAVWESGGPRTDPSMYNRSSGTY
jgi:hypothetical protein